MLNLDNQVASLFITQAKLDKPKSFDDIARWGCCLGVKISRHVPPASNLREKSLHPCTKQFTNTRRIVLEQQQMAQRRKAEKTNLPAPPEVSGAKEREAGPLYRMRFRVSELWRRLSRVME